MKKDKAIEILFDLAHEDIALEHLDYKEAIKLGIEALERCKERSDRFPNLPHLRLPSETID